MVQWTSARPRGRGFEPHRRHCVVVLEQDIFFPSLELVQPRKTHPCLTERLWMGLKESNQTNKSYFENSVYLDQKAKSDPGFFTITKASQGFWSNMGKRTFISVEQRSNFEGNRGTKTIYFKGTGTPPPLGGPHYCFGVITSLITWADPEGGGTVEPPLADFSGSAHR